MIVQACLGTPADVKRRMHMSLAPLHDEGQLIPVINLFEFHIFHRSAGDDHAIEFLAADLIEGHIKLV